MFSDVWKMFDLQKVGAKLKEEQVEKTISIILRLPGLLLLDYWFQTTSEDIWPKNVGLTEAINSLITPIVLLQSVLLLLLPLEDLVTLYMHYISAALLVSAELFSRHYVFMELMDSTPLVEESDKDISSVAHLQRHIVALVLHILIAKSVSLLLDLNGTAKRVTLAVYTVPIMARLAKIPPVHLEAFHKFSTTITVLWAAYYSLGSLPRLLAYLRRSYRSLAHVLFDKGLADAVVEVWQYVYMKPLLLSFWCVLLTAQLYTYYHHQKGGAIVCSCARDHTICLLSILAYRPEYNKPPDQLDSGGPCEWYRVVLSIALRCFRDLCLTLQFAGLQHRRVIYILGCSKRLSTGQDLKQAGTGEAITMALLSLQTGLVDLTMPQRVGAMSIILFIVVGSLLQSMHDIVEPILLALSASHTYAVARHARVLALCTFLFVFPLYMTIFLCRMFEVDFWTLVVVSTCALTSVQVLGALTVYALFLYDAMQKESGWESLDDMVYIARGITRALEFIVALLVVGAGIRESMLLSSEGRPLSWLNGTVLAVHCYYNVYQRLQSGWSSFLLRRDAARKIHSLPCATAQQLDSRAHDVCAICYMEMKSARVTPCGHLFHATCLKKWLYVQDRCPLCATKVTTVKSEEAAERIEGAEEWLAPGQQMNTSEEHSVSSARRDCRLASGEQTDIPTSWAYSHKPNIKKRSYKLGKAFPKNVSVVRDPMNGMFSPWIRI
uniref:RING-type domain-containing protein n=1 Tax=Timema monikensis TaxID=170555 RepID=A0A7R9E2G5_9NEOP|nr:unnamed protein product [Timema monikensis]